MPPIDASLTAPVIATWGGFGVILIVLAIVVWKLAAALIGSYEARLGERDVVLRAQLDSAEKTRDTLRELRAGIDAMVKTMEGVLSMVRSKAP